MVQNYLHNDTTIKKYLDNDTMMQKYLENGVNDNKSATATKKKKNQILEKKNILKRSWLL